MLLYPDCPVTGEAGLPAVVQVDITVPPAEPEAAMFTAFVMFYPINAIYILVNAADPPYIEELEGT